MAITYSASRKTWEGDLPWPLELQDRSGVFCNERSGEFGGGNRLICTLQPHSRKYPHLGGVFGPGGAISGLWFDDAPYQVAVMQVYEPGPSSPLPDIPSKLGVKGSCPSQYKGFTCTLQAGHPERHPHLAGAAADIAAVWFTSEADRDDNNKEDDNK